jgi:hypothetical protein
MADPPWPLRQIVGTHPQHPGSSNPRIGPASHQGFGPAGLARPGVTRTYDISYRGLKLSSVSAVS